MTAKIDTSKFTPLFRQWLRVKQQLSDTLVMFRLGDFYELFGDDAEVGARELGLTLTARESSPGQKIPMCGVPHHALQRYLRQLVEKGHRVAVVEQTEDPKKAKGLVRRDIMRVVSPGTILEDELLPGAQHNFLASVARMGGSFGLALTDMSTGDFLVTEIEAETEKTDASGRLIAERGLLEPFEKLLDELARVQPAEILLAADLAADEALGKALGERVGKPVRAADEEAFSDPGRELRDFFGIASLEGFGCADLPAAQAAAAQALRYLRVQRPAGLPHFAGITTYWLRDHMVIDAATRRNLELERTLRDNRREGALLWLLDRTRTPMGARLLRSWLLQPLLDLAEIRRRQDAVGELIDKQLAAGQMREALRKVYDIERLTTRITAEAAGPRDLRALCDSLARLPELKAYLAEAEAELLEGLRERIDEMPELAAALDAAIVDQPPAQITEGGIIRDGYNAELDELRGAAAHGREWVADLEQRERGRTGIKSLRVGYNQVFGYYIEVTNSNLSLVPPDYQRKQTLSGSERFITPELKQMEERILGAEERGQALEHEIFVGLRAEAGRYAGRLADTARALAVVDVILSLAEVAAEQGYCKPEVDEGDALDIREGRHAVVERLQTDEPFVPNDCYSDCQGHRLLIITGPNMAGKSTYLRQVALIALMAQMGGFVPARSARVGLVDRIFTRVGASDDLASGRSTFMIEMTETANILHNATERSLVILDEIGRGTSTFDGLSLAWAVAEHMARQIGARTLFATHYHHLNELAEVVEGVRNYRVAVKEEGDRIIFLRKIVPGGTDRSYGLQVARLAGIPEDVLRRAQEVLHQLEQEDLGRKIGPTREAVEAVGAAIQLQLFDAAPDPEIEEIRKLDVDSLSPIEALMKLKAIQERIAKRRQGGSA
jgi:DNA mismatch repair protein MutS